MNGAPADLRAASRTDAGVHALGQVVAFDAARDISPHSWLRGLNSELPESISVRSVEPCDTGYNPRYDARGKHYRYLIQTGTSRDPLMRHRTWYVKPGMFPRERMSALDAAGWFELDAMRRAAEAMTGTHDFRAFRASNDVRERTVRTLTEVRVTAGHAGRPEVLAIDVRGTAFLKNMVRIIAGTLLEVGRGRMQASRVPELLTEEAERQDAGMTAPAQGLTLLEITLGRLSRSADG